MKTLFYLIVVIVTSGSWGALQAIIFSPKTFGDLYIYTAIIGCTIISWVGKNKLIKLCKIKP